MPAITRQDHHAAVIESLERRQLLAADLAASQTLESVGLDAAAVSATPTTASTVEGTNAASFYAGRLKFSATEDQPRRARRDVVVNVTAAEQNGSFTGTIAAAGLGNVAFDGQLAGGRRFSAVVTGDVTGNLYGEIRNRGNRLIASIVREDGSEIGITTRAATPPGQTIVFPADGVVGDQLAAGTLAFTGLAGGRATFRQAIDDPTLVGSGFSPGRFRNDLSLDITDQTSTGLLGGTLRVGEVAYPVNGIANNGRLTLLVLPEAGTVADAQLAGVSTGVLRLNVNPFGTGYAGRFSRAGAGVLDSGRLALTRAEPLAVLPSATGGSLGGLLGAIEAGSFRGDPLTTVNTGIGTPISTGTGIGTPIDIGTTRISPIFSGTEIGTPSSTGTQIGTPIFTGVPASTAPRGFAASAPTSTGLLLDQTYRGGGGGSLFG